MYQDKDITHALDLIRIHTRRQHHLESQEALQGVSADPALRHEIEDIEHKIDSLRASVKEMTIDREAQVSVQASFLVAPLLSPLEKYDVFFRRLAEGFDSWMPVSGSFKQQMLTLLHNASRADAVFLVRQSGTSWESIVHPESKSSEIQQLISTDIRFQNLLLHSIYQANQAKKVDPNKHANILSAVLPTSAKICLLTASSTAEAAEVLVIYGMESEFECDTGIAAVLNALLKITNNLTKLPGHPIEIEVCLYNSLKQQFGYVSDFIFERQFTLLQRWLQTMTVFFEPTIALFNPPTIFSWEALARDKNHKAPVALFKTAELWGRRFTTEVDLYFLRKSVENYLHCLSKEQQTTRPMVYRDLSVNVYPDTLMRHGYRRLIRELAQPAAGTRAASMPLNKLILEISEKAPIPSPDPSCSEQEKLTSFRKELLRHYMSKGIRIAIDDFGVGHASSSRLSRLGTAIVKIDRDALLDTYGEFVLEYVIKQALHMPGTTQVIVEGLDGESQFSLAQLYQLNIRYIQGHSLGKPEECIYRLSPETEHMIQQTLANVDHQDLPED